MDNEKPLGLMGTARDQWATVRRLLRLVPDGHPSRQQIAREAEICQLVLQESQNRIPEAQNQYDDDADELVNVLEEVICEIELTTATG